MIISTILPIILNENIEKIEHSLSTGGQSYAHLYYTTFKNFIYDLNLIVICGIILSGDKNER